jgi:hypothetical protein
MPRHDDVRRSVEHAVETAIQKYDSDQLLRDDEYYTIRKEIADDVINNALGAEQDGRAAEEAAEALMKEMKEGGGGGGDLAFITTMVAQRVQASLDEPAKPLRFAKFERVVCNIGGDLGWAPGTIQALAEEDPEDGTGRTTIPYVVKMDPPVNRLISVPRDEQWVCRAEVCFGQMCDDDLGFALRCKPARAYGGTRGFAVGDRVACAVEDATGEYTVWAAGTVSDVDYDVEQDAAKLGLTWNFTGMACLMPYRVLLDDTADGGSARQQQPPQQKRQRPRHVYVHRDAHWLLRDLALQPAGPRQSKDGARDLKRIVKRRRNTAEWELIDHATRKTRIEPVREDDDDEEE